MYQAFEGFDLKLPNQGGLLSHELSAGSGVQKVTTFACGTHATANGASTCDTATCFTSNANCYSTVYSCQGPNPL